MNISIPRQAEEIIEKLNRHGFEAFVVGGCVRDSLMGREPGDWDITTSARPQQVKEIFGRTIDTGIKHGTVTIMRGKVGYEVTTYRIDGEYEDGRHPKSVEFTSDLVEDLKRRDFTMNAMAYSSRDGLVDVFGGVEDMRAKKIRCVGKAEERFTEDALRILRALRFSAQLGFQIEEETKEAMGRLAPNLVHVSKERIQAELTKLLLSDNPGHMRWVFESGVSDYVSDTFSKIDPNRIVISRDLPVKKSLRWAALLRHQTVQEAKQVLLELKLDNDTISRACTLAEWWRKPIGQNQAEIRRTMSQMSAESYDDLLMLKKSILDCHGTKPESMPEWDFIPETYQDLEYICTQTEEIRSRGDCISLKTLAVTGGDLIAVGMKPGKEMGQTLERLLGLVLEHPQWNTKERLLEEVRS